MYHGRKNIEDIIIIVWGPELKQNNGDKESIIIQRYLADRIVGLDYLFCKRVSERKKTGSLQGPEKQQRWTMVLVSKWGIQKKRRGGETWRK